MFYARALMHGMAFLSAAHASLRGLRFGVSMASSSAMWRSAKSQSGCLSCGSRLTNQRRKSATCGQRVVACPLAGNGDHVPRQLFACQHQVGRASFGAQRRETALPPPTSIRQNLWKSNQGSTAMQRPSVIAHVQQACLFSPALAPVPSLTGRSSGHQYLLASIGTLRAAHSGAAYLER